MSTGPWDPNYGVPWHQVFGFAVLMLLFVVTGTDFTNVSRVVVLVSIWWMSQHVGAYISDRWL